jgi:hypothetical protein
MNRLSTITAASSPRCPDCGAGDLSRRVFDHDTQVSYPLDDDEHFCRHCDCVWLDADVMEPVPTGWALAEQAALRRSA